VVQSFENLTPRGLQNSFSTNDQDSLFSHSLDSFLLSSRREEHEEHKHQSKASQFKYMIFVWNGKSAGAMLKALALTKGYELDTLLAKGKDHVMQVFFSGGVIRGKKLQRGSVYVFDDVANQKTSLQKDQGKENPNAPSAE